MCEIGRKSQIIGDLHGATPADIRVERGPGQARYAPRPRARIIDYGFVVRWLLLRRTNPAIINNNAPAIGSKAFGHPDVGAFSGATGNTAEQPPPPDVSSRYTVKVTP